MKRWQLDAALGVALVVAFLLYGCSERRAGVVAMQLDAARDTLKANAAQRADVVKALGVMRERAAEAEARADVAKAAAREISSHLAAVGAQRDSARKALLVARAPSDSLAALLLKSAADDRIIDDQRRVIVQREREAEELRASLASLKVAEAKAAEQLERDAQVDRQVAAAIQSAKPSRWRQWGERAAWFSIGFGAGKLAP